MLTALVEKGLPGARHADGRDVQALPAQGSGRRYALLDLLRYVAALMVALMHWSLETPEQTFSTLRYWSSSRVSAG